MNDTPPQSTALADPLRDVQIAKLKLEIERLQKTHVWERYLQPQVVTLLVALLGFSFGFYQFYREQQKNRASREVDQRLRLQKEMRDDIDELHKFPKSDLAGISRASFLLEDLKTILHSPINETATVSDLFPDYERKFTQSLAYQIIYDSDFEKRPKDVSFATTALEHWDDYRVYLKKYPNQLNFILDQHVRALRYLRNTNPSYLEDLVYNEGTKEFKPGPDYENKEDEEKRYEHFLDILNGFRNHLNLLADDQSPEAMQIRTRSIQHFVGALCNKDVARQVLRNYFLDQDCEQIIHKKRRP